MQIVNFVISSAFALVVFASVHKPEFGFIAIAVYIIKYMATDFLREYRGIGYTKTWSVITFFLCLNISGMIISNYLDYIHLDDISHLVDDFFFGVGVLTAVIALDRTPPKDKTKKTVMTEALQKVIDKVKSVYGLPSPTPANHFTRKSPACE